MSGEADVVVHTQARIANGTTYRGRTEAEIAALLKAGWLGGVPASEIALALNVTLGFVGRAVVEAGLPARDHNRNVIAGSKAGTMHEVDATQESA